MKNMDMFDWLIMAVVILLLFGGGAKVAFGQTEGHMRWHNYYQSWKQPGTQTSCCNARQIGPNGEDLSGDCEPTRYEIRDGGWVAWLRQENRWIVVPDNKLIRERNPSGEEGHLCAVKQMGGWVILCAVPPDTGG